MNKFKKPYTSRTSTSRPGSSRPSYGPARPRTTSPRDSRSFRDARGESGGAFQKFDAICSNCGKKCQVPFRPDGQKPVYCKDCFGTPREALAGKKKFSPSPASFSASAGAAGGKSIADLTRQIAAMNAKIDTMLKLLTDGGPEEE
jgi:CxxC-x17-CxxC domain-containing protein